MEFLPQLLTLAGVMLLACISPGPDFIAITSHALTGRRAGLGAAMGVSCACTIWATLAVFGLGVMLSQMAWAYEVVRFVGAAYLIYLGLRMMASLRRQKGRQADDVPTVSAAVEVTESRRAFLPSVRRGLLVGLTNPKSMAFFGSLFVTVLPVGAPTWVYATTIAVVVVVAIGWFTTLAMIFSSPGVRSVYGRMRKPFDAVMGAALIGLGVKLAMSK
ncbi:LysE family translocator [Pseudochelatococcus sp. G4_1912]|uniref:LysE family translocator n=1 Tax=Pseudochelatococcus sp. G4_1912 TaxID=3114288 RepID=UPI0039C5BB60